MDKLCPLLEKPCIEHHCRWFIHIVGRNPNTGTQEDQFGCAVEWLPVLLIENAQKTLQTTSTLDKMREEMRKPIRLEVARALEMPGSNKEMEAVK